MAGETQDYSKSPRQYRKVTGAWSQVPADGIIVVNAGGPVTITLLDPTTVSVGQPVTVKNITANTVTVASAGSSKTIDGGASASLAQWAKGTYISDGTQWLSV